MSCLIVTTADTATLGFATILVGIADYLPLQLYVSLLQY